MSRIRDGVGRRGLLGVVDEKRAVDAAVDER